MVRSTIPAGYLATVRALARFVLLAGVAWLLAGLAPEVWLKRIAVRAGYGEDFTSGRLERWREFAVILGTLWAAVALALLTVGRRQLERFSVALLLDLRVRLRALRIKIKGKTRTVKRSSLPYVIGLLACLALGTGLRGGLLSQPVKYDEAYTYLHFVRRPLYEGLADYHAPNNHLLHTLLAHASLRLLGDREWTLRIPAFVAGMLAVWSVFCLGRRLVSRPVALLASAMTAVSAMQIQFSANARGYTLLTWLCLVLGYSLLRVVDRDRPVDWLFVFAASVLGFFTLPPMAMPFMGLVAWAALERDRKGLSLHSDCVSQTGRRGNRRERAFLRRMTPLALLIVLVILASVTLYAPAIVFSGTEAFEPPYVRSPRFERWLEQYPQAWFDALRSWCAGLGPWWLLSGLAVVGLFARWRAGWLVLSVLVSTVVLTALSRQAPPPRMFAFFAPFLYLAIASGAWWLAGRFLANCAGRMRAALCERAGGQMDRPLAAALLGFLILGIGIAGPGRTVVEQSGETGVCPVARAAVGWLREHGADADRILAPQPCNEPVHYYMTRWQIIAAWNGRPRPEEVVYLLTPAEQEPEDTLDGLILRPFVEGVEFQHWRSVWSTSGGSLWRARVCGAEG